MGRDTQVFTTILEECTGKGGLTIYPSTLQAHGSHLSQKKKVNCLSLSLPTNHQFVFKVSHRTLKSQKHFFQVPNELLFHFWQQSKAKQGHAYAFLHDVYRGVYDIYITLMANMLIRREVWPLYFCGYEQDVVLALLPISRGGVKSLEGIQVIPGSDLSFPTVKVTFWEPQISLPHSSVLVWILIIAWLRLNFQRQTLGPHHSLNSIVIGVWVLAVYTFSFAYSKKKN